MPHTGEQQQALDGFRLHLAGDGKAERTVQSYLGDVKRFFAHLNPRQRPLSALCRADVTGFRAGMVRDGFKPATVNKAVNSLSCFCRYLKDRGILPEGAQVVDPKRDRVKVAAGSEGEVSVLATEQIITLLALAAKPATGQRNRLIVHLLLFTGVRVGELVGIRLKDLDPVAGILTVRGKGGKYREVPLRQDLADMVKEYLRGERAASRFAGSEHLLVTQRAPKMHRDAVNALLECMGHKLGFPLHPHQFRHTFCSTLVKRGVPLTTVAKLAGHAGVETTARFYVNTSREDKAAAVGLL